MKQFINDMNQTLRDDTGRYSSRKVSALMIMMCVVSAHIEWLEHAFIEKDFDLLTTVLTIDYSFIATLLGLTTVSKIFKGKGIENDKTKG